MPPAPPAQRAGLSHDFREDYLQLNLLHERYPDVPRIALTATDRKSVV